MILGLCCLNEYELHSFFFEMSMKYFRLVRKNVRKVRVRGGVGFNDLSGFFYLSAIRRWVLQSNVQEERWSISRLQFCFIYWKNDVLNVHRLFVKYAGVMSNKECRKIAKTNISEKNGLIEIAVIEHDALPEIEVFKQVPIGRERILFIDDEEILAGMGKDMLERLGYHVTVRNNPIEATFQEGNCSVGSEGFG